MYEARKTRPAGKMILSNSKTMSIYKRIVPLISGLLGNFKNLGLNKLSDLKTANPAALEAGP
jgi:hypothetical protein